jgi:hypothetical protein
MSDIEGMNLPKPIKVKPSIAKYLDDLEEQGKSIFAFLGISFIEEFAQLYLLNKYQSKCFAKVREDNITRKSGRLMGLTVPLKINYSNSEETELKQQFTELSVILANCVKRGEKTILIPLNYIRGTGGHANMLILRMNRRELEHFEPHGGEFVGNQKLQESSKRILTFFVKILNREFKKDNLPEVNYVDASQVCPYIQGLQDLEGVSKLPKRKIEPGGYCAAWSIFFAELCLKNPDISSSELLDNVYNYLTTKKSGPDYLRGVIRGYAGFITQKINIYLSIFFKPNVTVEQIILNRQTSMKNSMFIIEDALKVLVELEIYVAMNPEFDLRKELKKAMKEYRDLTKGKTKEEQMKMRKGLYSIKKVQDAYYKKRILQNYEEYKRVGRVTSDPVFDSPQEITREKIKNFDILKKGLLHEKVDEEKRKREEEMMKKDWYVQQKLEKEEAKKQKASRKISPKSDKTKTKKNVIPEQLKAAVGNKSKLLEDIIRKENIDMSTNEGKIKLLKILQEMGQR